MHEEWSPTSSCTPSSSRISDLLPLGLPPLALLMEILGSYEAALYHQGTVTPE